jgi:ABC-type antimicrobial peptide transport system permease subunit
VGKRIGIRLGLWEIVGVVGDMREQGLDQEPVATAFFPTVGPDATPGARDSLYATAGLNLTIRASQSGGMALAPAVIRAVHELYPDLPVSRVRTMDDIARGSMARASFAMVMLGLAAGVALFLGAVGLYGVISYVVAERTREIGVRLALGAESVAISRMVLRQGFVLAATGIGIGAVASLGLTGLLSSLLHGVSPLDPLTFGTVALALLGVALVASWLPARRAANVDPTVALGAE